MLTGTLDEQKLQPVPADGAQDVSISWVIDRNGVYTPIEVKLTANPAPADIRHLELFLTEYSCAKIGFLICRVPRKVKLSDKVFALPWQSVCRVIP